MDLIDTHCHLYHKRFDGDRADALARAREAGIRQILMPAIDIPSIHQALELAEGDPDLYVMAALHPSDTKEATDADFDEVVRLSEHPGMVAIGETGLDYYWDRTFNERQHDFLRRHIHLAVERDLPLVFHNRDASDDLVAIVRDEQERAEDPSRIRGVFHCFGGTPEFGRQVMELGFHAGLGGTLTFKNGGVPEAIVDIPMDRIVLETDAPFLAPTPNRGKRNEPSYMVRVAERLAELRGMTVDEVADRTSRTARALFSLPEPA